MNCRESLTLDLADFLARASAPEFAAFRAHYPRCADCSAEMRAWTELYTELSASAHPSPDTLLRYQDASMPESDRRGVARHLATCAPCRDELRALAAFDRDSARAARPAVVERKTWFRMREWTRLVLHPALAYGLLLALLFYPALSRREHKGTYAPMPSRHDRLDAPSRDERAAPSEQERDHARQRLAAQAPETTRFAAKQRAPETPPASAPAASGPADAREPARESDSNQLTGLAKAKRGTAEETVALLRGRARTQLEVADQAGEVTLRAAVRSELGAKASPEVRTSSRYVPGTSQARGTRMSTCPETGAIRSRTSRSPFTSNTRTSSEPFAPSSERTAARSVTSPAWSATSSCVRARPRRSATVSSAVRFALASPASWLESASRAGS